MIFESPAQEWPAYGPDPYVASYPSHRFAALLHHASPDLQALQQAIDLAARRNVGYGYVTDDGGDNPWDPLPTFWQTEVDLVARCLR